MTFFLFVYINVQDVRQSASVAVQKTYVPDALMITSCWIMDACVSMIYIITVLNIESKCCQKGSRWCIIFVKSAT